MMTIIVKCGKLFAGSLEASAAEVAVPPEVVR